MGVALSLIFIAIGAILTWAVNASVQGIELHTVGIILWIVGLVGLLISIFLWPVYGRNYSGWKW